MSKLLTALICMVGKNYEEREKRLLCKRLKAESAGPLLANRTSVCMVTSPRAQLCLLEAPRKAARPEALCDPSPGARRSDSVFLMQELKPSRCHRHM